MPTRFLEHRIGPYSPTAADLSRHKAHLEHLSERRKRSSEPRFVSDDGSDPCWGDSICAGEVLMNSHSNRVSWWITAILAVIGVILTICIMNYASSTASMPTSSWSQLNGSGWIHPSPNSLGALVGIAIFLDVYTGYMQALHKGHLDHSVGQYVLRTIFNVGLWIFFLYGLAYYGTIGSMLALITLAISNVWSILTSHACSPYHTWLSVLQLVFIVFLIIWLTTCQVKIWPE